MAIIMSSYSDIVEKQDLYSDFMDYSARYNRTYQTYSQYKNAFHRFSKNIEYINNNNFPFKLDRNEYMDMSFDYFHLVKKGYVKKLSTSSSSSSSCSKYKYENKELPDSLDWRDVNAVTPVKNQGQCGSCWSFSATGAMEGAWAIKNEELVSLSEQLLMDCSVDYGDYSCNGGEMESAFEFAIDNGMCSEEQEPYLAKDEDCMYCNPQIYFSDCVRVTPKNEIHLKEAVSRGPVSVAIQADTKTFQFYSGGIISGDSCGTNLDHGVLIVGYGEEDGEKYWIVKNSWGASWGENGYVRISRSDEENTHGVCGIAMQPSYPVAY